MDTFPRTDCDIVAHTIRRTQPDPDLLIAILGLVEQPGIDTNNSLKDASHVTRPPLWETPVIGELRPVGAKTSAGVRAQ